MCLSQNISVLNVMGILFKNLQNFFSVNFIMIAEKYKWKCFSASELFRVV